MAKNGPGSQAAKMAELTFALLERCQEKQERMASALKLTVSEFKVMRAFQADTVLTAGELARRTEVSNSRLTRILDGLVKKGIVRRDLGLRDRRVMEVHLTERGRKVEAELEETYIETHQHILELLPAGGRESVILAMEKLGEAMKEWSKR